MKKIVMLLMVSVFFLMGGEFDGVAQSNENGTPQIISDARGEIVVRAGNTAQWSYELLNLENWSYAALFVQRPGEQPKFIIYLDCNGNIHRANPSDYRFDISYNYYKNIIYVTLSNAQASDEGVYYLMVRKGTTDYFSAGDQLTVLYL
ncbi:immunoglobulin domain-containing protein [uncultured Sanguibacteroides sp.]|uniref:immunoglobulin domain-containing protein n=1 Tax=uncultured Sanguibacteroides sp. TaxID=1635151 RepID=UPI0025FB9189|nr:immunoglobulin domain-containing protein [uncultured Sanguibacteroides sp.]